MRSEVHLIDCIEYMKQIPDKYFDLACVDPPYGISINANIGRKKGKRKKHADVKWDNEIPSDEYFTQLFRVTKNQIIWGGNYFPLPPTKHIIFWDKCNPDGLSFSDGELAWTSFDRAIRKWTMRNTTGNKIHPTQKPIALYSWIFHNYANTGDKILDTHLGSGSSRIAAHKAGIDFVGCEIDPDYYQAQERRFKDYVSQLRLF